MTTKTDGEPVIELPAEFVSGNSVPVTLATVTRDRMAEILSTAIAPYQQRIVELESQLEAIGAGGVDGRRLIGDSCHQRIEELEAELQELQRQWVEHDTLGFPTAKTGIYASKADRQRRGEPVAWIRKNGFRFISEIEPQDDNEVPLYAAPQPVEPDDPNTSPRSGKGPFESASDLINSINEPVKVPSDAISVVGVPEFDALMDHIYESGTASEGVLPLANAFARALLARYGHPAEPEGWQLVPKEPTEEMLAATSWPNCAGTDYKHMLSSAPKFGEEE